MTDVFISYSRLDREFVGKLRDALAAVRQDVWIDWESIPPSQAWWGEIQKGIAKANNFVVILTPHAMESPICQMEIEHARTLGKRIIPVLHEDYEREASIKSAEARLEDPELDAVRDLWGTRSPHDLIEANDSVLDQINYFYFRAEDDFTARFDELFEIIHTDYEHKERHTTLQLRAEEWVRRNRDGSFLLLDAELAEAQEWLHSAPGKIPVPSPLHIDYIHSSEKRTRTLRYTRLLSVVGTSVAVVAIAFAIVASIIGSRATNQARDAEDREAVANTEIALASNARFLAEDQALTAISDQATARSEAASLRATSTVIPATLTQAAVIQQNALDEQDIAVQFANTMLGLDDAPDEGIARLDTIAQDFPQRPSVFLYRGLAYDHLGQFERAINDFDHALELDPGYGLAYYNRGLTYYNMRQFERAIEDFDQTIERDPENIFAYINRGNAYFDMGDRAQAIADYDRAIERDPRFALTYANRGLAYGLAGDFERALEDLSRAIELDPGYALAIVNRGNVYNAMGDLERAFADFDQAVEIDPTMANAFYNRGVVYYNQGELQASIADFNRAIEIDPVNSAFYLGRAAVNYVLEDFEAALADWSFVESLGDVLPPDVVSLRSQLTATPQN
jgi:tetratricopeptide (TPR) repeat protein